MHLFIFTVPSFEQLQHGNYPYESVFLCFVERVLAACLGHTFQSYDGNELSKVLLSAATVRYPAVISFVYVAQ
jgi:hypothetical protein